MSLDHLKDKLPAYAKDLRLNLSSLASDETFAPSSKWGLMLACAIATRNPTVAADMAAAAAEHLSPAEMDAARAAASIMAMNNVYYRFVHLASNKVYSTMPAKLRMTVIANPGVPKIDFELWSLAVSSINGCGACMDAHEKALVEAGMSSEGIQAAIRYAAVIQGVAVSLEAAGLQAAE